MTPLFFISIFLLVIAFIRFLIAVLNYLTRPILPFGKLNGYPLVSVLIPARNEEMNIGRLLEGLVKQSYWNLEIIVYDDQSFDNTSNIVQNFSGSDNRISLVTSKGLPKGWLGKNYACNQLAQIAKGDYFLFLDADVTVSSHFIENAISYIQRKKLVLLSMFPRQELNSFGEKLVVPTMNWILLSLLLLPLVRLSRRRSLAAANGQMMLFNADVYRSNQWHEMVKSSAVEDITISRLIKRKRFKMATLLGTDDISCRMYGSYSEAINGFTKNVSSFFGGSNLVTIVFALVGTVGPFLVIFSFPFLMAFSYFFFLISARILLSRLSEQSFIFNVLLWPLQHLAFLHLVYKSYILSRKKKYEWKGRTI